MPKIARWLGRIVRRTRALFSEIKKESGWEQLVSEAQDVRAELKENDNAVQTALNSIKKDFNTLDTEIAENINDAKEKTFK